MRALAERLQMRRRVYPRWVASGKMAQADMDREIRVMEALVADHAPRGLFDGGET